MNRAERALGGVALLLAVATLVAALHDVSTTWDVWYYHLPFAARLWRIVPPDAYELSVANAERYRGFPLLGELLQGLFWKVTGRPECANLVALSSLALYAVFLKRFFAVPAWLTAIALMAIPLVHTHATSCYVDLPANIGASVLVLGAYRIVVLGERATSRLLLAIVLGAACAANMRFQLNPLVALTLAVVVVRVAATSVRELRAGGPPRRAAALRLAAIAVAPLLVFATPLKNVVIHHNPVYPVALTVGGHPLPHAEDAYAYAPPHLAHAPQPVRFVASVLEIGARPFSDTSRWSVDQWAPPESRASRIGGSFGAYVVAHLVLLAYFAWRDRTRAAKGALALFGALTAVTAVMPQSHELRYYLSWEIVLVSLILVLACRRVAKPPGEAPAGAARIGPVAIGAMCTAALAVVIGVTRGTYVTPSGSSFETLLRDKVDSPIIERIEEGERVCLNRWPWTLLYASMFHVGRRYVIREAESRAECGNVRWLE